MFGNLKKKLNNAIQEGIIISENLQQQYRQRVSSSSSSGQCSTATTPTTPISALNESLSSTRGSSLSLSTQLADGVPTHLNLAAGCNLLAKYEDDWQQIHASNDENAARAASVAAQIETARHRINAQQMNINDLNICLSAFPTLLAKLKSSEQQLNGLEQMVFHLEEELEKLEDLCDECELQEFMLDKQFELSLHKQKKINQLEHYRQQIAAEHHANIRGHEQRLRQIQRERQAVFDDAFRSDLEEYKQRGHLTKILTVAEPISNRIALDEVILDNNDSETKDALEQFLNG